METKLEPKYGFGEWLDQNKQKIVRMLVSEYLEQWLPLRKQDLPHISLEEQTDDFLTFKVETFKGKQYTVVLQRIDYDRYTKMEEDEEDKPAGHSI